MNSRSEMWRIGAQNPDTLIEEIERLLRAALRTQEQQYNAEITRLREALHKMIEAGRNAYDNGYPEMERAVVAAVAALEAPCPS